MRHTFNHVDPEDPLLFQKIPIKYVVAVYQLSAIVGLLWAIVLQFALIVPLIYLLPPFLFYVIVFAGYTFEKKGIMTVDFWLHFILIIFSAIFICFSGFNLAIGVSGEVSQFWRNVVLIALDIGYIWMSRKLINAVALKASTITEMEPFYAKY